MFQIIYQFIECLLAFLLGSIPFGIYVCHHFNLSPPNTYGSKNIGASNVARQNMLAGLITLLLDMLKGYLAIKLFTGGSILLLAAVIGHCYSPILKFNGGKGVATLYGCLFALEPAIGLICMILWATIYYQSRIPARSSVVVCILILMLSTGNGDHFTTLATLLVAFRHRKNALKKSATT